MAVGIDLNRKKIPDAQMSCHYCSGDSAGVDGRFNAPQGWLGENTNSWLQVHVKCLRLCSLYVSRCIYYVIRLYAIISLLLHVITKTVRQFNYLKGTSTRF